jgi:hypothetical protein
MNKEMRFIKYVVFLHLILWYSSTSAYEICKTEGGKDIKWNNSASTYDINTSGGPAGSLDAIIAGMQTWTDVATSNFTFNYGGTTASTAHGVDDGTNIVTFGSLPVGTVGENLVWYVTSTGRVLDSDVRFNTYYTWSTNGSGGFDVQNVGTHEHGHSLCLADLYGGVDSEKTMYGYVSPGETEKQTLDQDDIDGITDLYTCPNLPARILDTPYEYSSLQDAYDDSVEDDVIQSQATIFTNEDLFVDDINNKSVTLKGGYDCDYLNITGITTLQGNMTISNGTLTTEYFSLE